MKTYELPDGFVTKSYQILNGFDISVKVTNYTRNAAEVIYNSARTTWPILLPVEYSPDNKICQGLVEACAERAINPALLELATIQLEINGMTRVGMAQITRQRSAIFNVASQDTAYENWQELKFVRPRNFEGKEEEFEKLIEFSVRLFNDLAKQGVPPLESRYVLPEAIVCKCISWNTTPNQIANIASFRMCNSCSPDENNLVIRTYIKEFSKVLEDDLKAKKIDSLTYTLYKKLLANTDALGFRKKEFSSFNSVIKNSGRFTKEAEKPKGLKKLQETCKFNTVDWATTSFRQELLTGNYILMPGEEEMLYAKRLF